MGEYVRSYRSFIEVGSSQTSISIQNFHLSSHSYMMFGLFLNVNEAEFNQISLSQPMLIAIYNSSFLGRDYDQGYIGFELYSADLEINSCVFAPLYYAFVAKFSSSLRLFNTIFKFTGSALKMQHGYAFFIHLTDSKLTWTSSIFEGFIEDYESVEPFESSSTLVDVHMNSEVILIDLKIISILIGQVFF